MSRRRLPWRWPDCGSRCGRGSGARCLGGIRDRSMHACSDPQPAVTATRRATSTCSWSARRWLARRTRATSHVASMPWQGMHRSLLLCRLRGRRGIPGRFGADRSEVAVPSSSRAAACTAADARTRLKTARAYLEVADLVLGEKERDEYLNVAAGLAVLAGIAA